MSQDPYVCPHGVRLEVLCGKCEEDEMDDPSTVKVLGRDGPYPDIRAELDWDHTGAGREESADDGLAVYEVLDGTGVVRGRIEGLTPEMVSGLEQLAKKELDPIEVGVAPDPMTAARRAVINHTMTAERYAKRALDNAVGAVAYFEIRKPSPHRHRMLADLRDFLEEIQTELTVMRRQEPERGTQ